MKLSRTRILPLLAPLGLVGAVACAVNPASDESASSDLAVSDLAVAAAAGTCATTPNAARSLFVTDATALADFPMKSVLDQIVKTGSTTGQTSLELYQQLVDTLNDEAHAVTKGPHCDDQKVNGQPAINGWPEQFCPRQEGTLAKTDPFTTGSADSYVPLGIVNRFDLAPNSGANCGQYRVVFGKLSGKSNPFDRMLVIFEAVMPNPKPSEGLVACLPVARFWDDLTNDGSATSRAAKLKSFYFDGLPATATTPAFVPVIRAQNYGIGGGTNTGQIRANMFMNQTGGQEWELREFRLSQSCTSGKCTLTADNTAVQTNPFGPLFAGTDAAALAFQKQFLTQVGPLAAKTVAGITMTTSFVDDGPQSDEQVPTNNDYAGEGEGNAAFLKQITAKLATIGRSDLTAQNILDRATTQSCAGCHELAIGRNLGPNPPLPDGGIDASPPPPPQDGGGGAADASGPPPPPPPFGGETVDNASNPTLIWPFSNGFTQISEESVLSPALQEVFLPSRAATLKTFIDAHCGTAAAPALVDDGFTVGGSTVGAAN